MIKIDFEFESDFGFFRDALYLPLDHGFSDDQIELMKQERFNDWLTMVLPEQKNVKEDQYE